MNERSKRVPAAIVILLAAGCSGGPPPAEIAWRTGSFDAALSEARARKVPMIVDVYATWCGPCRNLDAKVWDSPEGAALASGNLPYRVDFDTDEGQTVKRRFKILGLPTVLFLAPDGTEVDRVEGFPGPREWLAEARPCAAGRSPMKEARAALRDAPGDPEAQLRLGHLLLVRGDQDEGLRLLGEAAEGTSEEVAAESLFVLGRYFTRAAEEPGRAIIYWRRLQLEHPGSDWSAGALYWLLKSYEEDGRLAEGMAELDRPGMLEKAAHYEVAASYLQEAGHREEARALARRGLDRFPGEDGLLEIANDAGDTGQGTS